MSLFVVVLDVVPYLKRDNPYLRLLCEAFGATTSAFSQKLVHHVIITYMDTNLLNQLKSIVFKNIDPKMSKVFIFGSRATGTNRKYSDVDLGLQSELEIPYMTKIKLEDEFENSNLPYKVDVVDFSKVAESFKKVAMQKVIYLN